MCAPESSRRDRLRHIRHERSGFHGRFFEKHPAFWPIAAAARTFADRGSWPDVADYADAFASDPPVRFERAPPKRRRPAGVIARAELYDAVIVNRRVVPTRAAMWHDYLNALVWATFPRAKLALHRRQHAAIERWVPEGATQLPNARTRELDTLALVDEGGVLVLDDGERPLAEALHDERSWIFFGHALFEGLVFDRPAMISRAVVLDARRDRGVAQAAPRSDDALTLADALLAAILGDTARIVSPEELPRLPLPRAPPSAGRPEHRPERGQERGQDRTEESR